MSSNIKKRDGLTRMLFVCYGNICRSPMAEGFANNMHGSEVEAQSAGIGASPGKATVEAQTVMKRNYDIDISSHRATYIDEADLDEFDYIIAMDKVVFNYLRKTGRLNDERLFEWDIEDPMGRSIFVYEKAAEKISERLEKFFLNREVL